MRSYGNDYNISGLRTSSWWKKLKWSKLIIYFAVILFIYDFIYFLYIYHHFSELNADQELRLQEFKSNSTFSEVYYTMHRQFGDATLKEKDLDDWRKGGKI